MVLHESASADGAVPCALSKPHGKLVLSVVHPTELDAYVDDGMRHCRTFRLDSGASVSCSSGESLAKDKRQLLSHGKRHKVRTPMTVSGLANGHVVVTAAPEGVQLIIGRAKRTHNFLVVPRLVCGYLLGQDFMASYDMQLKLVDKVAIMGVPPEEWMAGAPYRSSQTVNIRYVSQSFILEVDSP